MVSCCVPFCKSRSRKDPSVSFHEFPSDSLLRSQWMRRIARKDFIVNDKSGSSVVCSRHFLSTDYCTTLVSSVSPKHRRLKKNAVPSVFPDYPSYALLAPSASPQPQDSRSRAVEIKSNVPAGKRRRAKKNKSTMTRSVFQCDVCLKDCGDAEQLKQHVLIHYGVKPFVCEICFRAFTEEAAMFEHIEKYHEEQWKRYTCDICSQFCKSQSNLTLHKMKVHNLAKEVICRKSFKCGYCPRVFRSASKLMRHMAEHLEPVTNNSNRDLNNGSNDTVTGISKTDKSIQIDSS